MRLGYELLERGDVAAGLAEYRACVDIMKRLAARDPTHAPWQRTLMAAQRKLGQALFAQDGTEEAGLAEMRAQVVIAARLAEEDPATSALRDCWLAHGAAETPCSSGASPRRRWSSIARCWPSPSG